MDILTVQSVRDSISVGGLYQIGYAWLFGMSVWNSFFAGTIAYRALPRHQFGALQHRIFPAYFLSSILLSALLSGLWISNHPGILSNLLDLKKSDVFQLYMLSSVIWFQGCNHFVIGPMTSRTMFQRHKLEKKEGKDHHDVTVSDQMKSLNRRFAILHGFSSLGNLFAIIALLVHGLYIGTWGVHRY